MKVRFICPAPQLYLTWCQEIKITTSQILPICQIIEGVIFRQHLFLDFSKAFDSNRKKKMEQILLAFGLSIGNVISIMMLYKNMKAMAQSPNNNTNFFNVVTGALQGYTLALYMFIICLDYVVWMSVDPIKENGGTLKKARSRKYPTEMKTCRWSSTSHKFTCPSRILFAESEASSRRYVF